MINFYLKDVLNELKNKNIDSSINKNITILNSYDDYQLKILAKDGIKLNKIIRLYFNENIGFRCINLQQEKYGKLPICNNIEKFLNEKYQESFTNVKNIIEFLKSELVNYNDCENWKQFIDEQKLGDCQTIVNFIEDISIQYKLPVIKRFGEIEIDEAFYNIEHNEEINKFAHHWITINGVIFEFSKGTLKNYIEFVNLYDIYPNNENNYLNMVVFSK